MKRPEIDELGGDRRLAWAGLALGGVLAGALLPRLLKQGRLAGRSVGGTTFRASPTGSTPPNANPAAGRPA